jgi:hypothetical protein
MPDQSPAVPEPSDLSSEIEASLASIWARHSGGGRPSGAVVAVESGVVRWTLPNGLAELEEGLATTAEADEAESRAPVRTTHSYKRETSAAVARATGRKVNARVSKLDKKTGVATESFILAPSRVRN